MAPIPAQRQDAGTASGSERRDRVDGRCSEQEQGQGVNVVPMHLGTREKGLPAEHGGTQMANNLNDAPRRPRAHDSEES